MSDPGYVEGRRGPSWNGDAATVFSVGRRRRTSGGVDRSAGSIVGGMSRLRTLLICTVFTALGCDDGALDLEVPGFEGPGEPAPPDPAGGPQEVDIPPDEIVRPATCGDGVAAPGDFCPEPPRALPGRLQAHRVRVVDWDGDRRPDVVAAGGDGNLLVWRTTARRQLLVFTALAAPTLASDVAFGDFDGDGDLDLASSGLSADGTWIEWQRAAGFSPGPRLELPAASALAAGDVDGDGLPDLVVADVDGGGVTVLSAGADFAETAWATGVRPASVVLRDIDGDGNLDALVANTGEADPARDTVTVRFGDGQGGFAANVDAVVGNAPVWADAADLDGDGVLDLVAVNYGTFEGGEYVGGDTLSVVRGLGGRRFAPALDWPTGNGPVHLALADVDQDGDVDVLTADRGDYDPLFDISRGGHTVTTLLNDGAGGFAQRLTVDLPTRPVAVEIADLDLDASVEILVACPDERVVYEIEQAP